jgi:hypothetical protein
VLVAWYWWFARYNHRQGAIALRWIESACQGKARIGSSRWASSCLLEAGLRMPSRWFSDTRVCVRLLPRAVPMRWLMSRLRKQKETVTFEANLGVPPQFNLDLRNHVWSGHNSPRLTSNGREWMVVRPTPVVLTTKKKWPAELNPVVSALVTSSDKAFLSVRFAPSPPHFSATFELHDLADRDAGRELFGTLQDLASGVSARQT